jgi:hypothetical protein
VAAAAIVGSLAGCDQRAWSGPLASAADSIFSARPTSGCEATGTDLGFADARLPLLSCTVTRGDTTLVVTGDAEGKAVMVARAFVVDATRRAELHDSLQFAIGAEYGAPVICPQGEDGTETGVRLWNTLDRQLVLKSQGANGIRFELRVDHRGCPKGRPSAAPSS